MSCVCNIYRITVLVEVMVSEMCTSQILEYDQAVIWRMSAHEKIQSFLTCLYIDHLIDDFLILIQNTYCEDAFM